MSRIVRVWGYADSFALEFSQVSPEDWEVNVPPDLSDGQYAVELHAMNAAGLLAMWTGILYMFDGRCRIVLRRERFMAWLYPACVSMEPSPQRVTFALIS